MAHYSIKDLEKFTGIKAHTIRIWEKRYSLLSPRRTTSNIRKYSDSQLRKILKVASLYKQGFKISQIALMQEKEINENILNLNYLKSDFSTAIEQFLIITVELDENNFHLLFKKSVNKIGFKKTMINVIYPMLERVGVLWEIGSIHTAQEHFISNLIRQKLISQIDTLKKDYSTKKKRVILFLPEGELHELSLLFYSYLLYEKKYLVIYLGQSVPLLDLINIASEYKSSFFLTTLVIPEINNGFYKYLKSLSKIFPNSSILVFGPKAISLKLPDKVKKIKSLSDLYKIL